jgi:hypothetical protein
MTGVWGDRYCLPQNPFTRQDLEALADAGVDTFLAAYGGPSAQISNRSASG